jgi:hypothetical protein
VGGNYMASPNVDNRIILELILKAKNVKLWF